MGSMRRRVQRGASGLDKDFGLEVESQASREWARPTLSFFQRNLTWFCGTRNGLIADGEDVDEK